MGLTVEQIACAETNEALFKLLREELCRWFPPLLSKNTDAFLAALNAAPRGLRAMAAIYELDISMALDDLAWHFVNHHDLRLYEAALMGLRELEATEAAALFEMAYAIISPRWDELGQVLQRTQGGKIHDPLDSTVHDWLNSTGIQKQIDPLNREMWRLADQNKSYGLMSYWLSYARNHPERCIGGKSPTKVEDPSLPDEAP